MVRIGRERSRPRSFVDGEHCFTVFARVCAPADRQMRPAAGRRDLDGIPPLFGDFSLLEWGGNDLLRSPRPPSPPCEGEDGEIAYKADTGSVRRTD